jgi:hypothetical protein
MKTINIKKIGQGIREKIAAMSRDEFAEYLMPVGVPDPRIPAGTNWIKYDRRAKECRPTKYEKHLICRKDGKIHWETWNGTGWAYNDNDIQFWAVITPPISTNVEPTNNKTL